MTSFIIQGTSKPNPKPEKNTRSSLSLSIIYIFSPRLRRPHTAPAARFTPYIQLRIGGLLANTPGCGLFTLVFFKGNEKEREGRSKVEGSRSEYSPHELYSTHAQGIRSSYFPIHRSLPNNHGWKQAHEEQNRHNGSIRDCPKILLPRSRDQHGGSTSSRRHEPAANPAPQQPPRATGTTAPASAVVVPSQGPVAGSSHLHSTATEHGGTSHQDGLTTTADFGPILEQLQAFPPLPPRSTQAPMYTSNETLARVQLGSTHFSHPDPRSQVDPNLRVDQLTQRMDDRNNLMRQLLNQINLAQNHGLGQ
ncbi:unnamed protein product [Prunus armeniaca]